MVQLKTLIRRAANTLGYEIHRAPKDDEETYHRLFAEDSLRERRFYNVGAGAFRHRFWTNVDKESDWYREVQEERLGISWDLLALTPIPIDDGSAEIVYTSHTVEHITDEAAANFFREAYRILRSGGTFRLTTPNIDLDHRAYRENDRDYYYWSGDYSNPEHQERVKICQPMSEASIQQIFLFHFASSASTLHADGVPERIEDEEFDRIFREMDYEAALDHCISRCSLEIQQKYPGHHINWWNGEKMTRMLEEAGFERIHRSAYGQSFAPVLRNTTYFDNTHPKISLYIEAIR